MANQKYRSKLQRLYANDVKRLKTVHHTGRLFIETYQDSEKRFELKQKRDYRFVTHPIREKKEHQFLIQQLIMKVYSNMAERER